MISKPQPDEYTGYQSRYIKLVPAGQALDILKELQKSTYVFFSGMSNEQAEYAYAEGKWTLKQVLGHMIDTERVFSYRAFCFAHGEKQTLTGFDQEEYIENSTYNERAIKDLADEFKTVRESGIYIFSHLSEKQLLTVGHVADYQISVRALVYLTIGHEIYHLNLIKERYLK